MGSSLSLFYSESSKSWRERAVWTAPRLEWGGQVNTETDEALAFIIKSFPTKLYEWDKFLKELK
jgi:hypothetical protein